MLQASSLLQVIEIYIGKECLKLNDILTYYIVPDHVDRSLVSQITYNLRKYDLRTLSFIICPKVAHEQKKDYHKHSEDLGCTMKSGESKK